MMLDDPIVELIQDIENFLLFKNWEYYTINKNSISPINYTDIQIPNGFGYKLSTKQIN